MERSGRNITSGLAFFLVASLVLLVSLSGFDAVSHLDDSGKGAKNCPIYNVSQHQYGTFSTPSVLGFTLFLEHLLPATDAPFYRSSLFSERTGRSPPLLPDDLTL